MTLPTETIVLERTLDVTRMVWKNEGGHDGKPPSVEFLEAVNRS